MFYKRFIFGRKDYTKELKIIESDQLVSTIQAAPVTQKYLQSSKIKSMIKQYFYKIILKSGHWEEMSVKGFLFYF